MYHTSIWWMRAHSTSLRVYAFLRPTRTNTLPVSAILLTVNLYLLVSSLLFFLLFIIADHDGEWCTGLEHAVLEYEIDTMSRRSFPLGEII